MCVCALKPLFLSTSAMLLKSVDGFGLRLRLWVLKLLVYCSLGVNILTLLISEYLCVCPSLYQKPDGLIFPDRATLYVTAIEDRQYKDYKIHCECFLLQVDVTQWSHNKNKDPKSSTLGWRFSVNININVREERDPLRASVAVERHS